MATARKDEAATEVIPATEPEDSPSAAPGATESAAPAAEGDASPVALNPPAGTAAGEAASAEDPDPEPGTALAVPSEFTWEALDAAEVALAQSYRACHPHFAPLRAHRSGDELEFEDPVPGDWEPLTVVSQEWLVDRWIATAQQGVAQTFVTSVAAPAPPRQFAVVAGEVIAPDGTEEHGTEQFTAVSSLPVLVPRAGRRWSRNRG